MDSLGSGPIPGVHILVKKTGDVFISNKYGRFFIPETEKRSELLLKISGYENKSVLADTLSGKEELTIYLSRRLLIKEGVIIRSTRAQPKDGTVFTLLDKKEIERDNLGQDIPFLIENTPSLVATSEAGAGVGYTGIRIRGSDATRINVTINGIPFNDSESLGTYFVDIPDLAASTNSIQIQRGLGTSSNGAGAFGGTLNIETSNFQAKPFVNSTQAYGSYNTLKNNIDLGTGLLSGHWNFGLRLSRISSDGYIERASSLLKSFFFSAGYFGKKDLFKTNIFSGSEKTYQVFNGVPEDSLPHHRRFNPFTYANQTDNYVQDHFQLFYTHIFDSSLTLNLALHATHGKGYYEEYEASQAFSDYGIPNLTIGGTTIDTTNLIRRQWLDNYFYGTTFSLLFNPGGKSHFNFGGAYNQYRGLHFGEVIWSQYASSIPINYRYYSFNGFKTDLNTYLKYSIQIGGLTINADAQYRRIEYQFLGYDENKNNTTQNVRLNFFNPKLGLNYLFGKNTLYSSFGIGNKEPNQLDYSGSTPQSRPKPENLKDLEGGYRYGAKNFKFGINLYWMNYKDQLALTGQINDVGAYINTNVPKSSRTGIEADWNLRIYSWFSFLGNFTISRNKIEVFNEYLTDDLNQQSLIIHHHTDLSFSPSFIGSSTLDFIPVKDLHFLLVNKMVGKQYLDNTSNETRKIGRYFVQNIRLHYSIKTSVMKSVDLSLSLNNIFSSLYVSDGFTSPAIVKGKVYNNNNYYPQAPFNVLGGFSLHF